YLHLFPCQAIKLLFDFTFCLHIWVLLSCLLHTAMTHANKSILLFSLPVSDEKVLKAEPRQNVTLPCRAPDKNPAIAVEWTKSDLRAEHVLLYRDEQFDIDDQHPSFKNRVDLQDRQMKDGDVSLILNNVTINDTGTYKCHVFMRGSKTDHISIIHLHVVPPGE
uniref:Ig-like domain-containing protein n=1 Tax=Neolamprologus brichardi TaxID=32507 RepID=A0A3Q4HMF5_NEOBR